MAKKAVASLRGGSDKEKFIKVIKMVKSPKTGAYIFAEDVVTEAKSNDYFKK